MVTRHVVYLPFALKQLARIASKDARAIMAKVALYAENPAALANKVVAMRGTPLSRLRIGDYRVIFTADLTVVTVVKVGHRKDVYD